MPPSRHTTPATTSAPSRSRVRASPDYAEHGGLNYQLACFHALAGDTDEAARRLRIAFEADPRTRAWAEDDRDLDGVPRP